MSSRQTEIISVQLSAIGFRKRDLHTALVRNLTRIGLLTPRMAPKLESLGISPASA